MRMTLLHVPFVLAFVLLAFSFAYAKPLDGIPAIGMEASDFAPAGWSVESTVSAELSGDNASDLVVVLLQNEKDAKGAGVIDRKRALLWLHGTVKGYKLIDSNVGLLAFFQGLGNNGGDAAPGIEVNKRVVNITNRGGSSHAYGSVHRFRFENGIVRLIGVDHSNDDWHTLEQSKTSENLLTGVVEDTYKPPEDENGVVRGRPSKKRVKKPVERPLRLHDVIEYEPGD